MENRIWQLTFFIVSSFTLLSCNDRSNYPDPNELGVGISRENSQRGTAVMDSTFAGLPLVVGSEWSYKHSDTRFSPDSSTSVYTSKVRLFAAHTSDPSVNRTYEFQEIKENMIDTFLLGIDGNYLWGGGIWGEHTYYWFPLGSVTPWSEYIQLMGKEKITVAAGTFETYRLSNEDFNPPYDTWNRWYAPGIGIVRVEAVGGIVPYSYHTELVNYHLGLKRR